MNVQTHPIDCGAPDASCLPPRGAGDPSMKIRFAPTAAVLSVLAFLAWMYSTGRNDPVAVEGEGSPAVSVSEPSDDAPGLSDEVPVLSDEAPGLSNDAPVLREQTGRLRGPLCGTTRVAHRQSRRVFRIEPRRGEGGIGQSRHPLGGCCGPGPLFERVRRGAFRPVRL